MSPSVLDATFKTYNAAAATGGADRFGKKFFANVPLQLQVSLDCVCES